MEPPPAPTVRMSITGTPTGSPSTSKPVAACTLPGQSDTSVEVPPMSSVMMWSKPAAPATYAAPMTPPAGPLRTVRTG